MNEADMQIPEGRFQKRVKRESLLITVAFHAAVMALFAFATCASPSAPEEELTEIMIGGSGGVPGVDAPEGPTPKGVEETTPAQPQPRAEPRPVPEKIKAPVTRTPSVEKIPETTKEPKTPTPRTDTKADDAPKTPSTDGPKTPSNNTDAPAGRPDGTGDKPAGGTGGTTSGYSIAGLGNRGMIVRPTARYPQGSNATGTVTLRFTVLPNGDIINITPVKRADQALVSAATAGLRKAKFRPLPDNAPQSNQTGTITYRFELK